MDKVTVIPAEAENQVYVKFHLDWMQCSGELITYIPKVKLNQLVQQGQVLASVETSRCISTVRAPIAGKVLFIEQDVCDNPHNKVLFVFKKR